MVLCRETTTKTKQKKEHEIVVLQPSDCHEVVVVFKHKVFSELPGASCHAGRTSMTLA